MSKFQSNPVPHSPSHSADEDGWSTGSGSSSTRTEDSENSSYFTRDIETSLDQDDIEHSSEDVTSEDKTSSHRKSHEDATFQEVTAKIDITASTRTGASYDDIEDFSEWVSDSEKVGSSKNDVLLPTLDKSSDEESSVWHFELTPSSTNHQHLAGASPEEIIARFEKNVIRDVFDGENAFNAFHDIQENDAEASIEDESTFESQVSFSESPEPVSSSARDDSYAASKEASETSSNLFVLSSSSMNTSESRDPTTGFSPESSKSTSRDTSSAGGKALADSKPRRRRRRRPRASTGSESTSSHPSPSHPPRRKPRSRKPASNRKQTSTEKFQSNLSEIEEILRSPSTGSKTATGKVKSTMESSRSMKSPKITKRPLTSRQEVHSKTPAFQESPNGSQFERQHRTEDSATKPFNPTDLVLSPLVYSRSASFLKDFDCGLKTTMKRIHATINNEGYKAFVKRAYHKLLETRPRLKYLLSLSEWLHVHMLLLYARIFECELHSYGIALPREFQIAVPEKIMVFEPIAAAISSIGIVEEPDLGITYIPVARSYRGKDVYKPHNKDDVTEFLEWTQYDWNASWYQVEKARLERRMMAAEKNMKIPQPEARFDESKLEDWQQLVVEKWLGWDDDLWFSYMQACFVLDRTGHFVPFPRDTSKNGSYAWLLPRESNDEGAFVRIPRPSLSHDCWMIALMFDLCALEPSATATWYHETNRVGNVQHLIDRFLAAAMATTSPADTATSGKDE